jgi:hypothetical protein
MRSSPAMDGGMMTMRSHDGLQQRVERLSRQLCLALDIPEAAWKSISQYVREELIKWEIAKLFDDPSLLNEDEHAG